MDPRLTRSTSPTPLIGATTASFPEMRSLSSPPPHHSLPFRTTSSSPLPGARYCGVSPIGDALWATERFRDRPRRAPPAAGAIGMTAKSLPSLQHSVSATTSTLPPIAPSPCDFDRTFDRHRDSFHRPLDLLATQNTTFGRRARGTRGSAGRRAAMEAAARETVMQADGTTGGGAAAGDGRLPRLHHPDTFTTWVTTTRHARPGQSSPTHYSRTASPLAPSDSTQAPQMAQTHTEAQAQTPAQTQSQGMPGGVQTNRIPAITNIGAVPRVQEYRARDPPAPPLRDPPTRYGLTVFPDTRHIAEPARDTAAFASDQSRHKTSYLISEPVDPVTQKTEASRYANKLARIRDHQTRVQQTYKEEERKAQDARERRVHSLARQQIAYLEAVSQRTM